QIDFVIHRIICSASTTGFNWIGFTSAANYAVNNKVNLDQALTWADKAVAMNSNFNTLNVRANVLKAQGKTDDAGKALDDAVAIANENELNLLGYQLMNNKEQDKAIKLFIINTQRHPKSANVWDSLGEAYALGGDKKNAITNFK